MTIQEINTPPASINADQLLERPITHSHKSLYDKRIILAMRKLMQAVDMHSRRLIKLSDITVPQVVCLYELYENGAMTIAVIAKNIHLSPSTMVGIIDRLEEKQLVKRTRDTKDRRAVFVDITGKGKEFIQSTPHLLHNTLADRLNTLSEQEQIIIANSLDMLVHLVDGK